MDNILEGMDVVMQYITLYGPSVASVLGMVATVIVAIVKIKQAISSGQEQSQTIINELQTFNKKQSEELTIVRRENALIKKENREIKQLITRVKEPNKNDDVKLY